MVTPVNMLKLIIFIYDSFENRKIFRKSCATEQIIFKKAIFYPRMRVLHKQILRLNDSNELIYFKYL